MTKQTTPNPAKPIATIVTEEKRTAFLPDLFGNREFLTAEHTLYTLMSWLSPHDYSGGFWDYYELGGKALYMVPPDKDRYRLMCATNGFEGEVSTDAAGIIVTLFTFSHLSFKFESEHLSKGYHRLFDYACDHKEASAILSAID